MTLHTVYPRRAVSCTGTVTPELQPPTTRGVYSYTSTAYGVKKYTVPLVWCVDRIRIDKKLNPQRGRRQNEKEGAHAGGRVCHACR